MTIFLNKNLFFAFALSILVMAAPEFAMAEGEGFNNSFEDGLCKLINCFLGGGVIGVLGTLAITFLGISAFFGKVNWGLAVTVAIGLIIIVGAPDIAELFGGDACVEADCQ